MYVLIALALVSPAAQADVFDDAWSCAVAVKEGVVDSAIIGAKALKFIATKGDCVTRLGSPGTAAPIGVVVGLSNAGVLPKRQPDCSGKIYSIAAKPVAEALNATLGQLGLLKGDVKDQLNGIASGVIAGEVLANIPGMDFVSGSLTCGCDLVDAGLNAETIEKVLNTADNIGDKCGGPVWDAAKEVAGEVADFAGDAVGAGITAASNIGDALAGQTKHMPYLSYYETNWLPNTEAYAAYEVNHPNSWHGAQKWREIWGPCVAYFDGHTQSEDTAQYTCDNMRSGGPLFPKNYFGHALFQRVFDYEATVLVNAERENAYAEYADLKTGQKLPDTITDNTDCYAAASIKLHPLLPSMRKSAIDEVFGIPSKEKTHNGIAVTADSPPAKWKAGTVGAHALGYFDQVDAGQFHADAGKAVQLAMSDFDIEDKIRASLASKVLKHYELNKCVRIDSTDKDQQRVDGLVSQCPKAACKEKIADDYQACRADVTQWHDENASLISDFDSSSGQRAITEWRDRLAQCLDDAKKTFKENQYTLSDGIGTGTREPLRDREPIQRFDEPLPTADNSGGRSATDEHRLSREPIGEREPLRERDPIQRFDRRLPVAEPAREPRREPTVEAVPQVREPLRQYQVPAADPTATSSAALEARRKSAAEARALREQRAGAETVTRDPVVPEVAPVTDADLPGCYVFAQSAASKVYACTNSTAMDNCRAVVARDSSLSCRMTKD